jgi:hypothetical protein
MKRTYLFLVVLTAGCKPQPNVPTDASGARHAAGQVELRENLSAVEFKSALLGRWVSVFEYPSKRDIKGLEFKAEGVADLTIVHDGENQQYSGTYTVEFDRAPDPHKVTFAQIKISGDNPIALRRVNFGLHNGMPLNEGLLLRIDAEPHGVLKRATRTSTAAK